MQRSDLFAVLVAILALGAGAYLNTFPTEVIRSIGLLLIAGSIVGLIIWFVFEYEGKRVHAWGPWLLIVGGPVLGLLWLYLGKEQKFPGFTGYAIIRLYDTPEFRRRYVFEFVSTEGAKVSFYLSASSLFTFSVTDIRGESYPLEIKLGDGGIPIDQFVALFCEIGVAKNTTVFRVLVNEREVARRDLAFPLNLGKMDWKPGALGAPVIGTNQGGVFLLSELGIYGSTLKSSEVHALVENVRGFYKQPFD